MKFRHLAPEAKKVSELLAAVAKARGCSTPEEVEEFLMDTPPIRNEMPAMPDYPVARDRIKRALENREKIVVYGDYDCDGITSVVQMYNFLSAANANVGRFIPHRISEEYGLTDAGIDRCVEEHQPKLVICVDCASTATKQIARLSSLGIDTIVIDHHGVAGELPSNIGAVAHLNPKGFIAQCDAAARLAKMSAAGLVFLFTDSLADELHIEEWDRTAAIILGGLGTLVDVMPLIGVNRALVKWSLHYARDDKELVRLPGLIALKQVAKSSEISAYVYGFEWGPRLNATGRLDEANASVSLLLSKTVEEAMPYAEFCNQQNNARKATQEKILAGALEQAQKQVSENPNTKVIVVADKEWHTGIVGIVASKIKERFARPAFVCGWSEDEENPGHGFWKGSGRSMEKFDMGLAVGTALAAGYLKSGGGHAMAAGIRIHEDGLDDFRELMTAICDAKLEEFEAVHEVIGSAEALSEDSWCKVLGKLEPFGAGNPRPQLLIKQALLVDRPQEKRRTKDQKVFALSGRFQRSATSPNKRPAYYDWFDVETARTVWTPMKAYDMILSVKRNGTYINWTVDAAEQAAA